MQSAHPDRSALLEKLGVDIDSELLELALTHRSYAYEHGGIPNNERLEFLGDSILGQAVTVIASRAIQLCLPMAVSV